MPERSAKPCVICGRPMTWRKKWAKNWGDVKYCSDACRRHKTDAARVKLEAAILTLLADRAVGATICPSEAARAVALVEGLTNAPSAAVSEPKSEAWRDLMEPARCAGRRLALAGKIVFTQGGRVVDPGTARGASERSGWSRTARHIERSVARARIIWTSRKRFSACDAAGRGHRSRPS